jgi:hypothetical protein
MIYGAYDMDRNCDAAVSLWLQRDLATRYGSVPHERVPWWLTEIVADPALPHERPIDSGATRRGDRESAGEG